MGGAVQILAPAADGKSVTLDERALQEILCAEAVKDVPVVVLAIVGPRGTGKTTLLTAMLQAVSGAEAAPARLLCAGDRPGSAGVAVWSDLLPVTLPAGERAALLLMDTWGPFDDGCPAEQRAAVLMLSALVSSVLVVHVSAYGRACPLSDLMLLKELGKAAQGVKNCAPLQEVLFLMRQWSGAAPAGVQTDFEPLHEWAQGGAAAEQALIAIQEASDWYRSVSLVLVTDVSQDQDGAAPSDPAALLASQNAVKRFGKEAVPAAELATYFCDLAVALARGPCDGAALVRALVEANQGLAMRKAVLVYKQKMQTMEEYSQTGLVSEQDLRTAHDRAAHEAQLVFMMAKKMDGEDMESEGMKRTLLDTLDKQYKGRLEAFFSKAKRLEEDAAVRNAELGRTCKEKYQGKIQLALDESPRMPLGDLMKSHETCRLEALSMFDNSKVVYGRSGDQQRMDLYDRLEQLFRTYVNTLNQNREEAEAMEAMESHISGFVKKAEKRYLTIMEAVKPAKIASVHEAVQECALLLFESLAKDMPENHKPQAREKLRFETRKHLESLRTQELRPANPRRPAPASHSQHQHLDRCRSDPAPYGQDVSRHGVDFQPGARGTSSNDRQVTEGAPKRSSWSSSLRKWF